MKIRHCFFSLFLALLASAAVGTYFPTGAAFAEDGGTFVGTWTASGDRQSIEFSADRKVFTFKLEGHVNLQSDLGRTRDYWAECIGLWDSETGGDAKCVWSDLEGVDKAYLVLENKILKEDTAMTGKFVGGAGGLEGLEGKLSFTWSSLSYNKDQKVMAGFAKDLEGQWRIP